MWDKLFKEQKQELVFKYIDSINLEELGQKNSLLQIIPNKKELRFDKENLTLLSINA